MVKMGAKQVQSEDDIQGNARPLPGRYHAMIKHADDSFEKFDKVIVEFEVLAGTTPGQEGRTHTEFYSCTEKALPRLQRLALCIGLLQPGEEEKEVEFSEAEGKQLVIEVEENEYEKEDKEGNKKTQKGVRLSFLGMWSLHNKAVSDVPKNRDALKLLDEADGNGVGKGDGGNAKEEPEAVGATQGSDGGPTKDKWADL